MASTKNNSAGYITDSTGQYILVIGTCYSVTQIDSINWRFGDYILTRLPYQSDDAAWNDPLENASYTIKKTTDPRPAPPENPTDSKHLKLTLESFGLGEWTIGSSAVLRVKYRTRGFTPESKTMEFVRNRKPTFDVPQVYQHLYDEHLEFIFMQRLPGQSLDDAWPTLTEEMKWKYVHRVVEICQEMSQWTSNQLGGVDGQGVIASHLIRSDGNIDPKAMADSCAQVGMDCSSFHFFHSDLSPRSLMVESGEIGVIDFDGAGFLPRDWMLTNFNVSEGLNLRNYPYFPQEYRYRVTVTLLKLGFKSFLTEWKEFFHFDHMPYCGPPNLKEQQEQQ